MPYEQCRATNPLGTRCAMTAAPGSRFCRLHGPDDGPSPQLMWREPKTDASTAPAPSGDPTGPNRPAEGLDWLQSLLQQAMTEVMAGEGTPLQKASAIARLGNLYLKAHGAAELKRANKELRQQVEEMEARLAAAEARLAASDAAPAAAATSTAMPAHTALPPAMPRAVRSAVHLEPGSKSSAPGERHTLPLSDAAPAARSG
jgi:hypothetical protein